MAYQNWGPGQEQGISILTEAIQACTEEIDKHKGKLSVKEAPRAVSITEALSLSLSSLELSPFGKHWNKS